MKNIKYAIFLFFLAVKISSVYSQEYYTVEQRPNTDMKTLRKQLSKNYVDLNQIEYFPFDTIFQLNKNIRYLKIGYSPKLENLPESIKKFKSLKDVDIENVKFTKFPIGFCYLDSLTSFRYVKSYSTIIPKQIGKLTKLKRLELGNIPISEIPIELFNLENLENLEISNTTIKNNSQNDAPTLKFTGISHIPKEIGKLKHLNRLRYTSNDLTEIPKEIGLLNDLNDVSFWGNNLKSLPVEICNLQNLETLELSYNLLEYLPENIGNLKKLRVLNLYKNKLKTLPKGIENLTSLTSLLIRENQIPESEIIELKKTLPNLIINY